MLCPGLGAGDDLEMCLTGVPALVELTDRLSHLAEFCQPASDRTRCKPSHVWHQKPHSQGSSTPDIKYWESQGRLQWPSAEKAGAELRKIPG